jgi:hypothetical protein
MYENRELTIGVPSFVVTKEPYVPRKVVFIQDVSYRS